MDPVTFIFETKAHHFSLPTPQNIKAYKKWIARYLLKFYTSYTIVAFQLLFSIENTSKLAIKSEATAIYFTKQRMKNTEAKNKEKIIEFNS